ncbi:hypothetical protein [Bradyrhizobium sp. BWC-3-1]|uniref:hypothetical protein n=1 Tax=Bradyrhizobium sp. BWC-3-1 TaxID=3080012 RepID=UPI00293E7B94|nr:hypothetical protein [Bradyrhizobium sp. BWC-3-1]WOH61925.1 hypothetical protein RX329_18260 [Bradyrhizobium sp. BWC-3-1]
MTKVYRHDRTQIALQAMPGTLKDMADRIDAPKATVQHWIQDLRACGWAHVGKWQRTEGPGGIVPVFYAGPGRDAPCKLEALTRTEVQQRYRKRLRKSEDYPHIRAKMTAKQRLKRQLVKLKGRTPTPFDALMM